MKVRISLLAQILLWFFFAIFAIIIVLVIAFNLQFRLPQESILKAGGEDRMLPLAQLIFGELERSNKDTWDDILKRYGKVYKLEFMLLTPHGTRLAGPEMSLPHSVKREIKPGNRPLQGRMTKGHGKKKGANFQPGNPPPILRVSRFSVKAGNPSRYWVGLRLPLFNPESKRSEPVILLAISDTITGGGLFIDTAPWLVIIAVVAVLAFLLWIPLVRRLTTPLRQITAATEQIAKGRFDVRLNDKRTDEIGRLGKAINEMTEKLDDFVGGQKRFLGDVAHELASPIARIKLGLGILEQKVDSSLEPRLGSVIKDMEQMSHLVEELLSFTRAELATQKNEPTNVDLGSLIKSIVNQERVDGVEIKCTVEPNLQILADPSALSRAIGNVLRNALRYASDEGPIELDAKRSTKQISITVRDHGPGVPTSDISKIFDPFYSVDPSRSRQNGGVGLGLSIARAAVIQCNGTIEATNAEQGGLSVEIVLPQD